MKFVEFLIRLFTPPLAIWTLHMHPSRTNTDPAIGSKDLTKVLADQDMLEGLWIGKKGMMEDRNMRGEPFWVPPAGRRRQGCRWRRAAAVAVVLAGEGVVVGDWTRSPSSRLASETA